MTATVPSISQTDTPSPQPPLLVLLAPEGRDARLLEVAAEIAGGFAFSHGMQFQQLVRLDSSEIPANLSILIVLAPDPGATELAAAAASAQVIAIGFTSPVQQSNLQTLLAMGDQRVEVAFIAGYAAEITAPDWRAGMLYSPASEDLVDGFVDGARYFCGSCVAQAPPYNDYPQAAQAASPQDWQGAADELLAQSVNVVYLAPELESSGVADYLAPFGVLLIGTGAPPTGLEASWIASVGSDPAAVLRQQLPQALAGDAVQPASSLTITNANSAYLSEGRLAYIQNVVDDLLNGYIDLSERP